METTIEIVLAISVFLSGAYSVLLSNETVGRKISGLYKENKSHFVQKIQLLITGVVCIGFGIWWVLNPGLLF